MNLENLKNNIIYKIFTLLFKIFIVTLVVVFVFGQFITVIVSMDDIIYVVEKVSGQSLDSFFTEEEEYQGVEGGNDYFGQTFFNAYYIIITIAAVIGTLILSRMRSIYETMGLLLAFIIPRNRKNWGLVLNSENGGPIPFAIIRLSKDSEDGEKIAETVSDMDGKYRLRIPEDRKDIKQYFLSVKATGFHPHITKFNYVDDPLSGGDFIGNIALDKEKKSISKKIYITPRLYWYVMLAMFFFSFVYLIFAIYYYFAYPGNIYGTMNLGLYVFAFVWNVVIVRERIRPANGRVIDSLTRKPLADVKVNIYDEVRQLGVIRTDKNGVVRLNASPGTYNLRVVKEGYRLSGKAEFQKVRFDEEGYIDRDIVLEKTDKKVLVENPF